MTLALMLALSLGLFSTAAVAAEGNPTDCLQGVVYYGDVAQCRMTSIQALAYADAIEGAIGSLESKNASRLKRSGERPGSIHSYAALFDLGDGTPAVLFAGGLVEEYDWKDLSKAIRADGCDWANLGSQRLWYAQKDGVAVSFDIGGGVNIALHSGYVFWGGRSPDAGTYYKGKVYPLDGGKFAEEALTHGEYTNDYEHGEPVVYHVDGKTVTEAEFQAWQNAWEKSPILAGHRFTGGVGGTITGLGDARSLAAAQTVVDGTPVQLDAILLTDDAGNGYTYYQLRDLGKALGFNVGWSQEKGVFVETDKPYDPAN